MFNIMPDVNLYGQFINIGDVYLIRIAAITRWSKFNYIPTENTKLRVVRAGEDIPQYCILMVQQDQENECLSFSKPEYRDAVFRKICMCVRAVPKLD